MAAVVPSVESEVVEFRGADIGPKARRGRRPLNDHQCDAGMLRQASATHGESQAPDEPDQGTAHVNQRAVKIKEHGNAAASLDPGARRSIRHKTRSLALPMGFIELRPLRSINSNLREVGEKIRGPAIDMCSRTSERRPVHSGRLFFFDMLSARCKDRLQLAGCVR